MNQTKSENRDISNDQLVSGDERNDSVGTDETSKKSLHKRRYEAKQGDIPETLCVLSSTRSEGDGQEVSPGPSSIKTPSDIQWVEPNDCEPKELDKLCEQMIERLKNCDDPLSKKSVEVARATRSTQEALDHLEQLYKLMEQLFTLKRYNERIMRRTRDIEFLRNIHEMRRQIERDMRKSEMEGRELNIQNELMEAELEAKYANAESHIDSLISTDRAGSLKRLGSRIKSQTPTKFRNSILRRQRSRSVGGDDIEIGQEKSRLSVPPKSPRNSEEKSDKKKVSKWTKVKHAFKWEKAASGTGLIAGVELVGGTFLAGVVAIANASSSPPQSATPALEYSNNQQSSMRTPSSTLPHTPSSSLEEFRHDPGSPRRSFANRDENDNTYLQTPNHDDSSTSPSPNKLHKTPWGKMKDIIQPRKDSIKKKRHSASGGTRSDASESFPTRRRSTSDGDSDVPPALTLTTPSSDELGDIPPQHALRKQRSLELTVGRPPVGRRQESNRSSKWTKVKKAFLTTSSVSVPSSPSRYSEFFTEYEGDCMSSSGGEGFTSTNDVVRDEIQRDYVALQSRLNREFSDKRDKLSAGLKPVATEEQLSADFRKKLQEWQRMKEKTSAARQPPPVPRRSDLSEDFLKKWDEWKKLKETNSVPAWGEETKPDEVLVQTSTGLFKFQGISRSFTRKLYEWEKARGIAPEASTSALLQQAKGTRITKDQPHNNLVRAQSAGSVVGSIVSESATHLHASSLSVNDADNIELDYCDVSRPDTPSESSDRADRSTRSRESPGAVIVEVEAEEEETAALLLAAAPKPHKALYTWDHGPINSPPLCESTPCAIDTSTYLVKGDSFLKKNRQNAQQVRAHSNDQLHQNHTIDQILKSKSKTSITSEVLVKHVVPSSDNESPRSKTNEKSNGKKKWKSRARLEREASKPSESDTEHEADTVNVEIPKRRKKPRKLSEKQKSPHGTDSEGEIYVLKLNTNEIKQPSPEVIVKTTRKIFSPIVRDGEENPCAVIPLVVEDIVDRVEKKSSIGSASAPCTPSCSLIPSSRPPLPLLPSPLMQRRAPPKETSPSIRIMIERYKMKINEEGYTSGASSGTTSPAWRSPKLDRRRVLDLSPQRLNMRNNPFIEREVTKSASACHLTQDDPIRQTPERCGTQHTRTITPIIQTADILKSLSSEALSSQAEVRSVTPGPSTPSTRSTPGRTRTESENSCSGSFNQNSAFSLSPSERTRKIKLAKEKFFSNQEKVVECFSENETTISNISSNLRVEESSENNLIRSASVGAVHDTERDSAHGSSSSVHSGRFSLSRLAAKLRRSKPNESASSSAVSRLCRQSLLVQLKND